MHQLVNIKTINQQILCDIRYATTNNFVGKKMYNSSACYMQRPVAEALNSIQKELEYKGLGLKIFDAYRPLSVQFTLWNLIPDERYVANPKKGSCHNRGCAVDVTLVDNFGNELAMPTDFDDFTEKSHRNYKNFPKEVLDNSLYLEKIMTKHDFVGLSTEWWHFDFIGWEQYPVLNILFEELV